MQNIIDYVNANSKHMNQVQYIALQNDNKINNNIIKPLTYKKYDILSNLPTNLNSILSDIDFNRHGVISKINMHNDSDISFLSNHT